jgi:phosphoglycolate phosphatase-like HAD superfamily hydrolase
MKATSPTIFALDFDGVICDGLTEYFQVAWRTYCQIWSPVEKRPPDNLANKFYQLRPVIETGWEMPVLIRALIKEIPEEKILQEWGNIVKEILQTENLDATEIGINLDRLRDEWIETDLEGWLSLHRFYPGLIDRIKEIVASPTKLYIISTKEGRFVHKLLQQQGIDLGPKEIFGKESKRPKYEILRELIHSHNELAPDGVWFVEDRLKTLQLVATQEDLQQVRLFLADWGYNTPSEKVTAKNDPRIQLLSLSQFGKDFSQWN